MITNRLHQRAKHKLNPTSLHHSTPYVKKSLQISHFVGYCPKWIQFPSRETNIVGISYPKSVRLRGLDKQDITASLQPDNWDYVTVHICSTSDRILDATSTTRLAGDQLRRETLQSAVVSLAFKCLMPSRSITYISNFWHSGTLALRAEGQGARMSEIRCCLLYTSPSPRD